ncbi:hypothetical protein BGZ80_008368 [Entomortierella chlamydospora]|uniref:CCHC-type domain-containing protein n=1 Tax=Entomortierella chlamydospora TaxID=101097 RepID=A0A9P6MD83_9FUNG|nr:hypothetical protein BGZ80_008368 [Entomortierella chlamydospora]
MSQIIALDTFLKNIQSCSKFHGRPDEDFCLWIDELEEIFAILSTPSARRVQGARLLLRDNARLWVKDYTSPTEDDDAWIHFKTGLTGRFDSPNKKYFARTRLWQLKQRGSVTKYITEFETLRAKIDDINEGEAIQAFLNGLKPKLQEHFAGHPIYHQDLSMIKQIAESLDNVQYRNRNMFGAPRPFSYQQRPPIPDPMAMEIDALDVQRQPRSPRPRDLKQQQIDFANRACFHCHQPGHQARQCPTKPKNKPHSGKAQSH